MNNSIFAYKGIWGDGNIKFTSTVKYKGDLYTSDSLGIKVWV